MRKNYEPRRPYREFLAAIREELDAAAAPDIRFHESWLRKNVLGEEFLIEVPLGPEMVVPLRVGNHPDLLLDDQAWRNEARSFAKAIINLANGKSELLSHAERIRAATRDVVLAAMDAGLNVRLAGIRFKPTRASHLEDPRSACDHVLMEVDIETTSPSLGRQTTSILVEEEENIEDLLDDEFDHQRSRQTRLDELARLEADLELDDISLELLGWPMAGSRPDA